MNQDEIVQNIKEKYVQDGVEPNVIKAEIIKDKLSLKWRDVARDPSFWVLLFSNVVAIFFILKNNVPVRDIMLIYWMQSVIIGIVNVVRILSLKNFSTKDFKINNHAVEATNGTKFFTAAFFFVHYGLFHVVYIFFILVGPTSSSAHAIDWMGALGIASAFLFSHVFSLIKNFKQETQGKNIGNVMFSPYARIVPMHLAIIIGAGSAGVMTTILLFLKAAIDLLSHAFKHKESMLK